MKKNTSKAIAVIGTLLAAAVYCLLVFAFKKEFNLTSWIAFGFTIFAFLLIFIQACMWKKGTKEYPMLAGTSLKINIFYIVAQIIASVIEMAIPSLSEVAAIVINVIIVIAFIIPFCIFQTSKGHIQNQDEIDTKNVRGIREMKTSVEAAARLCKDPDIVKKLNELSEIIRYSDPVSIPETAAIEERIKNNISILREDLEDGNTDGLSDRVDKINALVQERNDKIRVMKS